MQKQLAAHIPLCQQWTHWQKATKELIEAGEVEKAREAYAKAELFYSRMKELEPPKKEWSG